MNTTPESFKYTGRVTKVTDGDTVKIAWQREEVISSITAQGVTTEQILRSRGEDSFRLIIIDTPERGEVGYLPARGMIAELTPVGSAVELITHGVDDGGFGRTLADVFPAGKSEGLSSIMLRLGLAEVWKRR